jgi:hypothetical protein
MPPDLLAGIDANTRNKIVFSLESADAKAVAVGSGLASEDFSHLPPYGIYASLLSGGRQTGWFSGRTMPPPQSVSDPEAVLRESQARYGADPATAGQQPPGPTLAATDPDDEPIGRAPRGGTS